MSREENNLSDHFDWEFVFQNKDFFNQLFSTYYNFSEEELIELKGKLVLGNPVIEFEGYNIFPNYGLIYNKTIRWTNNLILHYLADLRNITNVLLPYSGHYEIQFVDLPLDSVQVLEEVKNVRQFLIINSYSYSEDEEYYDSLDEELKNNDLNFYNILNQKEFSSSDLRNYITNLGDYKYYLSNISFCVNVFNKLVADIEDFKVYSFYSIFN